VPGGLRPPYSLRGLVLVHNLIFGLLGLLDTSQNHCNATDIVIIYQNVRFLDDKRGFFQVAFKVVTFGLDNAHVQALLRLCDHLEFESIERYASSDQEAYDTVFALECLRAALKGAGAPSQLLALVHQHPQHQDHSEKP
jgi:hypothetical protein